MVLDVILIVLLLIMAIYGYVKGFIKIIAKLVSVIVAFVLAYLLANMVGDFIQTTSFGNSIKTSIESNILYKFDTIEQNMIVEMLNDNLIANEQSQIANKIIRYVFTGMGFIVTFVLIRIVLWIVQKILEGIFELPVLKTFNKLGGVIVSVVVFVIEISIILAIINSLSSIEFMNGAVNLIRSSIITKAIYENNVFTSIIFSKII